MTAVTVALITGAFGTTGIWLNHQLNRRVGKPNGQGNLTGMVERLLDLGLENNDRLGEVEHRLDDIERGQRVN